jgi:hypothetical protein
MMKLRRLYEQAEEQGRGVEEVALERYGSLDEYNDALEERRFLDDRDARRRPRGDARGGRGGSDSASPGMRTPEASGRRFVFNNSDESRPASRQGFRRPGEENDKGTHTPTARVDALRRQESGARATPGQGATPIPSVFTPQSLTRGTSGEPPRVASLGGKPVMSIEQLNRLQAKVLRAKLTDDPEAEALEEQYERERAQYDDAGGAGPVAAGTLVREDEDGNQVQVEVLPTLDGQGRLYDVGKGDEDVQSVQGGKRRKKEPKVSFCGVSYRAKADNTV